MEPLANFVYIGGAGIVGALAGVLVGVLIGAEQNLQLHDQIDKLKKELGAIQDAESPQVIEITVPKEPKTNIPTFGNF